MKNRISKFLVLVHVIAPMVCGAQLQTINVGNSPDNSDGDGLRAVAKAVNSNFQSITNAQMLSQPRKRFAAVFDNWPIGDYQLDNGNGWVAIPAGDTNFCYRVPFLTCTNSPASFLQITFGNPCLGVTGTNILLRASVEYPAGNFVPIFFNGARDTVIGPRGKAVSDPVAITIPTNTQFWVRSFGQVPTGGGYDLNTITARWGMHGGGSTNTTDQTLSGTIGDNTVFAYGPELITAFLNQPVKSIGFWGDSIMSVVNVTNFYPVMSPCVTVATTNSFPSVNVSYNGAWEAQEKTNVQTLDMITRGCSHVLVGLGVNGEVHGDSFVTISNDLQTIWNNLAAAGVKVYQTTITPYSNSTDNWVTTANQTPVSLSVHRALNAWIRSGPAPLSGVCDLSRAIDPNDLDIWPADGTVNGRWTLDGLHPKTIISQTNYMSAIQAWEAGLK